ncbi:hypothetical protein [Halomonas sp. SL1]|uniref:hypothetical protein n=1 Tax=Halomonas sp. SL1 TaxID=2137478 RepID=UPI0011B94633|nr:hypothetical protein [Halomonas sp. SL1]
MFTENDYAQLPSHCPEYINIGFQVHQEDGLPSGVYKDPETELYYAVAFHGNRNSPVFQNPHKDPFKAHQQWQNLWIGSMRQALQYYNFSELYNEKMAKGIRLFVDRIEDDLNNNRESVI